MEKFVYEMKTVRFGNQSLKDCVKELGRFGIFTNDLRKDVYKENFLEYY